MSGSEVRVFPIVLSAPSPLYFFVRGDDDVLEITIEQINLGKYNPLKLHRVSFFMDIGFEGGSPMGFGFDGSMILPVTPSISTPDSAADAFNQVKASLLLGGLALDATSSSMIGIGNLNDTGYFRYVSAVGAEAGLIQALHEGGVGGELSIGLMDAPRITESQVLEAYSIGKPVFKSLSKLNAAFLALCYSSAMRREARNALIFGWIACEQVIEHLWIDFFLSDSAHYGSEDRRSRLLQVQNVSQKLELLLQSGIMTDAIYKKISKARKSRNDFAHKGGPVAIDSAIDCVTGLLLMIQLYSNKLGNRSGLDHLIASLSDARGGPQHQHPNVARAEDLDWTKVRFYRVVFAIPGDVQWSGDSLSLDGIQLRRPTTPR